MRQSTPRSTSLVNRATWLKGESMVRAYIAQRDQFLEMHGRLAAQTQGRARLEVAPARDLEDQATATAAH